MNDKIPVAWGLVIRKGGDFYYPHMDFDCIDKELVINSLKGVITKHKLGNYLLAKTRKGYQAHFIHDLARVDVEQIIQDTLNVDPDFKGISQFQDFRASRICGKYVPFEVTFLGEVGTPYPGKGSPSRALLLKAFLTKFWRKHEAKNQ